MHVVVVDTNVLLSALLGRSYPYLIIEELILKKKIISITSSEVVNEYFRVVSYSKFASIPNFESGSTDLIDRLREVAIKIITTEKFDLSPDKDDNKFLDLAYSGNADFLITGNAKHFPFGKFENTEIISPQKYWKTYWE